MMFREPPSLSIATRTAVLVAKASTKAPLIRTTLVGSIAFVRTRDCLHQVGPSVAHFDSKPTT
jgi:hypothetical protein